MNPPEKNLLAVAISTKRIGLAVFRQTKLLYFAVKTLKPPRNVRHIKRQAAQIFQKTVEEFKPGAVILKLLVKQQAKSKNQQLIVKVIRHKSETARIPLEEISIEGAKRKLCSGKKPTRENASLELSKIYPELKRLIRFQNAAQAEYYNSLLSAVAVGFYFQSKNNGDTGQNTPQN